MRPNKKKGQINDLGNLITTLGYIAILAAIIFLIIAGAKTMVVNQNPCENTSNYLNTTDMTCRDPTTLLASGGTSAAYNATVKTQIATGDIPNWFAIVVITIIGGVLLTLVRFFKGQQ